MKLGTKIMFSAYIFSMWMLLCVVMSPYAYGQTVAFWSMNEAQWTGVSDEVRDISGNGFHGTAINGASTTEAIACRGGWFRGEGYLGPPNSQYYPAQYYVSVADSVSLSPLLRANRAFALSGWFRIDNLAATGTIIHKGEGGNSQEYRLHTKDGRVTFTLWDRYGSPEQYTSNALLSEGNWYFFVAQAYVLRNARTQMSLQLFNEAGDTVAGSQRVYIDYTNKNTAGNLYLGATNWGNLTNYFDGVLDNIQVHDDTLSETDIAQLMADRGSCLTLLANYPLDLCTDLDSGILEDLTGNYPANGYLLSAEPGQVNNGAGLNRSGNDYIALPVALLNGRNDFSLSLWAQVDDTGRFNELLSASNNQTNTEIELYVRSGGEVRVGFKGQYYAFSNPAPLITSGTWNHIALTRSGRDICLYINGVSFGCRQAASGSLNVLRTALGVWWRSNGSFADELNGVLDEVLVYEGALSTEQITTIYTNQLAGLTKDGNVRPDTCLSCISDDFSGSSLSEQWIPFRSRGNFTPQPVNGRLRLTEARTNQATSVNFQRLFPAENNLVQVEFDYFAYGGSGADGAALVFSDAAVTPQPGSFGGPLGYGYKPGVPGFAGGWLGIGLDEYGNFSNEGGQGSIGRRRQSVVVRGSGDGQSGYRYLRGTCNNGTTNTNGDCLSPGVDEATSSQPHRYRITIDSRIANQSIVKVERDTGSGFEVLIDSFNALDSGFGQAPVPENFLLSFTGSTGGSTNIHELDNIEICALRSEPVGVTVDHFRLSHPQQTVRCYSADIQVQACADEDCTALVEQDVEVQMSSTAGTFVGGNPFTLTNGVGTTKLQLPQGGSAQIGVASSTPPAKPFSQDRCFIGGTLSNCTIDFVDAGLAFFASDGVSAPPTLRAGESNNLILKAVAANAVTGACEARVAGEQQVQLGLSCENPGVCQSGQQAQINGTAIGLNNQGQQANKQSVALTFNNQGAAPLEFNYSDVGQLQLHGAMTVAATPTEPEFTLQGSSAAFVSQPYQLEVIAVSASDGRINPATQGSGAGFVAAGEAFQVQVASVNKQGNVTPNFGLESPSQRAQVTLFERVYPQPGFGDGSLLSSGSFALTNTSGVQQSQQVMWDEAGSIRLDAAPVNDQYLATSYLGEQVASAVIGRFYPEHFAMNSSQLLDSCTDFTYMDQPQISLSWQAHALSATGRVLQNYGEHYQGRAEFNYVARSLEPQQASLASRFSAAVGTWQQGVYSVNVSNGMFARLANAQPDGPFNRLQLGAEISSEIDNRPWRSADMVGDSVASCSNCTAKAFSGLLDMRYGRLRLENNFGSEFEPLLVPMQAQYWQGQRWAVNGKDHCSAYTHNDLIDSSGELSTTGSGALVSGDYVVDQGIFADSEENPGTYPVSYPAPDWLLWDWNGDNTADENPSATLKFGTFRGNDRIIYWREQLN